MIRRDWMRKSATRTLKTAAAAAAGVTIPAAATLAAAEDSFKVLAAEA